MKFTQEKNYNGNGINKILPSNLGIKLIIEFPLKLGNCIKKNLSLLIFFFKYRILYLILETEGSLTSACEKRP